MLHSNYILYSFRRCPYAIRARLALHYCNISYEHREVDLKAKPKSLLHYSPKGTVPVLILPTGEIIDESLDIVNYAFSQFSPPQFKILNSEEQSDADNIYTAMHDYFIPHLVRLKYPDRFDDINEELHREKISLFLDIMTKRLLGHDFVMGDKPAIIDLLVFPFIRQLNITDSKILLSNKNKTLKKWFDWWVNSSDFNKVMAKHPNFLV